MKKLFPVFLVLLLSLCTFGQQGATVIGTVTDQLGEPLPAANVRIPVHNLGGATDTEGKFLINVPAQYITGEEVEIVASFVGYESQTKTITLSGQTIEVDFSLEIDIFESEDVVITGIASRTSKAVAEVAVSRVKADQYTDVTGYQSLSQLVTGKVAGVQLQPASGNIGGGFRFYVRGGGGLNGDEQPIIYIDGVRVDDSEIEGFGVGGQGTSVLSTLNPEDIENIEFLKGPAAAATYGTSGSNGVVLITTKSGGRYQTTAGDRLGVNYKYIYGYNTQSHEYSKDYIETADDANKIFRDGIIRQNTLSISGGSSILRYHASVDNRFEEGHINSNYMDRTSLSAKISAYPSEVLSLTFSGGYTDMENARPNNDNNIYGYLGNTILYFRSYAFLDSLSIEKFEDINNTKKFRGSANFVYSPFKSFEISGTAGLEHYNFEQQQLYPIDGNYTTYNDGGRSLYLLDNNQYTYDINARYSYSPLKNLNITSIVGAQVFQKDWRRSWFETEQMGSQYIKSLGSAAEVLDYWEDDYHERQAGIFTEHSLSYLNQYFLTLALRQDWASAVGDEAPSITYPKASFAIRMDKYDFFPSIFSLFKLRTAYGINGVLPELTDGVFLLWEAEQGGYGGGAVLSSIGNVEIEPESVEEIEVGVDMELFNRLSLEFTYYKQYASNSLVDFDNAPSTGLTATATPFNVGGMENSGFESLIQATPWYTSDFRLDLSMIWNYQTNEVTDLGGAQPIYDGFDVNVIKEGLPKHQFHTHKVYGAIFDDEGNYAGVDASEERVDCGSPIPKYTGSFTINFNFLRNFNLYILSDWALDLKVFNYTRIYQTFYGNNVEYNNLEEQLFGEDGLTPGTQEYITAAHDYARMNPNYDGNYVEDADYLKIREISLSYNFRDILPFVRANNYIKDFVMGFSARNLWTTTKYSGADPEMNFDGGRSNSRGVDFLTLQNPKTYNFFLRIGI